MRVYASEMPRAAFDAAAARRYVMLMRAIRRQRYAGAPRTYARRRRLSNAQRLPCALSDICLRLMRLPYHYTFHLICRAHAHVAALLRAH